jgi:peptidyl-prolyl cis-trans isomerase C
MPGHRSLARLPAVLLLLSAPAVFGADAQPVARVGTESVSAQALIRRLATIPDFQRAALGDSPERLKRRILDTQLVPELLFAQEAERLKLDQRPSLRQRQREILRDAMEHELAAESAAHAPVTAADIRGYFEANRARFETPRRIHIWRILSDDEALTKRIISESKGVDGIQHWTQFAREFSLDKATHLRGGDLGFVHPDGNTDTPSLRVDATLFGAADQLSDGQLSPQPLREGSHFAVIWRRGSMKAVNRSLAQEEGSIRQVLERQRLEQARNELLGSLRSRYLRTNNEALLDTLHFDLQGLATRQAAARPAHAAALGSQAPQTGERGER